MTSITCVMKNKVYFIIKIIIQKKKLQKKFVHESGLIVDVFLYHWIKIAQKNCIIHISMLPGFYLKFL